MAAGQVVSNVGGSEWEGAVEETGRSSVIPMCNYHKIQRIEFNNCSEFKHWGCRGREPGGQGGLSPPHFSIRGG